MLLSSTLVGAEGGTNAVMRHPGFEAPKGAGGDSLPQAFTTDGRFVVFCSTALNLVPGPTGAGLPERFPNVVNVYVRDLSNAFAVLVSEDLGGAGGGDGDSVAAGISDDGRYVLFESRAANLVANDTNRAWDVFLRDTVMGQTVLVSATPEGGVGAGNSMSASLTPDGNYAVFTSEAPNLVGGDTNAIVDVFRRDLRAGETRVVSEGALALRNQLPRGGSWNPGVTPDGRFVVFFGSATNLVTDPVPSYPYRGAGQVYLRDMTLGTVTWVSREAEASVTEILSATNHLAFSPAVSQDGAVVAYLAGPLQKSSGLLLRKDLASGQTRVAHTNAAIFQTAPEHTSDVALSPDGRFLACAVNGPEPAGVSIFLWDEQEQRGVIASAGVEGQALGQTIANNPAFDPTGVFLGFYSNARNLVTNTPPGEFHEYVRNVLTGETWVVDSGAGQAYGELDTGGKPLLTGGNPVRALFAAADAPGAAPDNAGYDIYVRDLSSDAAELASPAITTLPALGPNRGSGPLKPDNFSVDGRYVAFWSWADDLVPGDTNGCPDVFVRDMLAGTNILVSINTNGAPARRAAYEPSISGNGRRVAFTYKGNDMSELDANDFRDVYVRDLDEGTTSLVSLTAQGGTPATANSENPLMAGDGKGVMFRSTGAFGYSGATGAAAYHRDLEMGTNIKLNPLILSANRQMPDPRPGGPERRYFAFFEDGTTSAYVWDAQTKERVFTNAVSSLVRQVAMHPSGKLMAVFHYDSPSAKTFAIYDLAAGTNAAIPIYGLAPSLSGLAFSDDGEYLVYSAALGPIQWVHVFLYHLPTGSNTLVSADYQTGKLGNYNSDMPAVSPDGRFVAYRTRATNILPDDTNGVPDLLLYDRVNRTTVRLGGPANAAPATQPVFSPDGLHLFYNALASGPGDFNRAADIYVTRLNLGSGIPVFATSLFLQGGQTRLTWPAASGVTYRVEARDAMELGSTWSEVPGTPTVENGQGHFLDITAGGTQRFYRVKALGQ